MKPELELRARELLLQHAGMIYTTMSGDVVLVDAAIRALVTTLEAQKTANSDASEAISSPALSTPSNILMREALEERARIVGYLGMRADSFVEPTQRDYDMRDAFLDAADEIEAGKHDSISVGGGVVVGEQGVTGDGLRPQPAGQASPGAAGASPPFGDHQAQEEDWQ